MATIIALEGAPSTGKTTTIGKLYDKVKESGYTVIQDRKRRGSKEFFVIVQKKGTKIGITTYGDSASLIREKFDYFIEKGCSILISACRAAGTTKNTVESYRGFRKIYHPKTVAPESRHNTVNNADANVMFELIEGVL